MILKKMDGQLENNWTFKRKEQAVGLGAKVKMKNGTLIQMNPQNLFDRMIAYGSNDVAREQDGVS